MKLHQAALISVLLALAGLGSGIDGLLSPVSAQVPPHRTPATTPQTPHRHGPTCRRWVPPSHRTVEERVWVEGSTSRVWVPPQYRTSLDPQGNPVQVLVRAGFHETVKEPGRHEIRQRKVTVPGRWELSCGRDGS
jgi:hypothetical protein